LCKITLWSLHEICSILHFCFAFRRLRVHICAECSQSSPLHTEAVGTQHPTKLDVSQPEISHTKPSPLSTIHISNLSCFSSFPLSKCWNATACLKCAWPLPITCSSTYHSTLHNFCSWKSVVKAKKAIRHNTFTLWLLRPGGKSFRHPLNRSWLGLEFEPALHS